MKKICYFQIRNISFRIEFDGLGGNFLKHVNSFLDLLNLFNYFLSLKLFLLNFVFFTDHINSFFFGTLLEICWHLADVEKQ